MNKNIKELYMAMLKPGSEFFMSMDYPEGALSIKNMICILYDIKIK